MTLMWRTEPVDLDSRLPADVVVARIEAAAGPPRGWKDQWRPRGGSRFVRWGDAGGMTLSERGRALELLRPVASVRVVPSGDGSRLVGRIAPWSGGVVTLVTTLLLLALVVVSDRPLWLRIGVALLVVVAPVRSHAVGRGSLRRLLRDVVS